MRRLLSFLFVLALAGVVALKTAEWTAENWWMASLGFGGAQNLYWKWRLGAFVPVFAVWWVFMGGNARLAWHNARWRDVSLPLLGPRALVGRGLMSSEESVRLDSLARRGATGGVLLGALLCGVAAANHFDMWVLALHPPTFEGDASAAFLVGVWPALLWTWSALGVLWLFTLGLVAAIAAFEGVLDFDTRGLRVGDATARHMAALGALLLLWIGGRCALALPGWTVNYGWSPEGVNGVYERAFTNPARAALALAGLGVALWFARSAPKHPLRALVVAGVYAFCALFVPLIAPSFGRAVRSDSSLDATLRAEQTRHIEATRRAWGLDRVAQRALNVETADFLPATLPSPDDHLIPSVPTTVAWPSEGLRRALAEADTGGGLGRTPGDVFFVRQGKALRAQIIEAKAATNGVQAPLLLECDPARAGVVTATRRELDAVVLQSPFAPENALPAPSPQAGESLGGEVATPPVAARVRLLETDDGHGVTRANALEGAALALHFGDSSLLGAGPPLTWHLDPLERVATLAPFVWWAGARPHPVLMSDGGAGAPKHLFWLVEGCFVARSLPASAMLPLGDEWSGINYARQGVLGVCDAGSGETRFYLFDPTEPLARAWNALLPGFFRPASELLPALRAGTRLSPALLSAQTTVWARYHRAPRGEKEALLWSQRKDEWRALPGDTSGRATALQPTLLENAGRTELAQIAAFAPTISTLPADQNDAPPNATPLTAILSARDEGAALWADGGHPALTQWRPKDKLALPLGDDAAPMPVSPLGTLIFEKRALALALDGDENCVGLSVSRGTAQSQKVKGGAQWTLTRSLASTKAQLPPATATAAQSDARMASIRALWKAWQAARAAGRWARVEELERQLNSALAP